MSAIEKAFLGEKIAWVAVAINTPDIFRERARVVTEEITSTCIPLLPSFFHHPPSPPEEGKNQFSGLGQWMSICQEAIFEMLYYFRESALPLLRQTAFGDYDWTQILAIEVLCRFANEGLEREQIEKELARELPRLRYETVMSVKSVLVQLVAGAPQLAAAFHALIHEYMQEDVVDALDLIEALAYTSPSEAKEYEGFLRNLIYGKGLANRHLILDGHLISYKPNGTEIIYGTPLPDNLHAIRAALVLLRLIPDDKIVLADVRSWVTTHPDEKVREELRQLLERRDHQA